MIYTNLLSKIECNEILKLTDVSIGYSDVNMHDRDYCEWLIESNNFNFLLEKLLKYKIYSLPDGRIIKYNQGNYFEPHTDQFYIHPERYKTLIIQLNDDYIGGELCVNGVVINKEVGTFVLFDSTAIHSVSKIISGLRYSLVFWIELKHMNKVKYIL